MMLINSQGKSYGLLSGVCLLIANLLFYLTRFLKPHDLNHRKNWSWVGRIRGTVIPIIISSQRLELKLLKHSETCILNGNGYKPLKLVLWEHMEQHDNVTK